MLNKNIFKIAIILIPFFLSCSGLQIDEQKVSTLDIPKADREFRGAWVATVANINWPSKKDLTTEEQKAEAITIIEKLYQNNFNAIIFQARPQCDALYKSDLEPWSYYLTGAQGKAPNPFYDPLQFWIDEAHKRGMELHVWLNPYRAHHTDGGEVSELSIVKKNPKLVVKLKTGYWWLDPSKKETQDYSYNVVMDITKRYDVDGIHFDDYFYPYPSYNNDEDFPDDESWKEYLNSGGKLAKADWRRNSVNVFIERVYKGIKKLKPNVKFGLSPFGIWRPKNPKSVEGFDQYEKLYADAKLWINKGWVDYWSPQLYWKISTIQQSFPILLGWWKEQNLMGRHFWPGISVDRDNTELNSAEVVNQMYIVKGMLPESPGSLCWSVGPILKFSELSNAIVKGPYKKQALIPNTPWFKGALPNSPNIQVQRQADKVNISWDKNSNKDIFNWVVYYKYGTRWEYKILTGDIFNCDVPLTYEYKQINDKNEEVIRKYNLTDVAVSAVDKISNESIPTMQKIN